MIPSLKLGSVICDKTLTRHHVRRQTQLGLKTASGPSSAWAARAIEATWQLSDFIVQNLGRDLKQVGWDHGVVRAGAEPFEIKCDILEPKIAEDFNQFQAYFGCRECGEVVDRDFDTCQVTLVVSDPADFKALFAEPLFAFVDHPNLLRGNDFAVSDTT